MDINKIFELFSDQSEDGNGVIKFKEHPLYWIALAHKLYYKHNIFSEKVIDIFSNVQPKLDMDEVKKAGNYVIYVRCWEYLSKLDLTNYEHTDILKTYSLEKTDFIEFVISLLLFFESYEEYEKCITLKNISDVLKTS
jgi:hypothetical protein